MDDYREDSPITYVANGIRGSTPATSTADTLTNFDAIDWSAEQATSFPVFLRDDNFNEVDYVNWRIGNHANGTNLASKNRLGFGLALAQPFEEPTIYEYTIAGYTDSDIELIPFVGQIYGLGGGPSLTGEINAWNGSQDITGHDNLPYNWAEYHLLPSEHNKGFSVSAEGHIAMHTSYGPSWTEGYYVNNTSPADQGTLDSPVIIGVIAFNDQTSAQNMKNTDISISGRRLPLSADAYKSIPYA